jgi:DNA N-6-adenine-methyltransferase Dam
MSEHVPGEDAPPSTDSWCTPPEVAVPLCDTLYQGPVSVDPFSNERSIVNAILSYFEGGFTLPWWLGKPGDDFENPPYSLMTSATAKLIVELKLGHITQHVRLIPAMTSSRWWARQCLEPKRNPRVMFTKRISFLDPFNPDPNKRRQTCRHEPALVYYGPKPALFDKAFKHLARWSTWGR